jgi:archaellum component FlaC
MIYLLLVAVLLLACGWFMLVEERKRNSRALRELERRTNERLEKLENAFAKKTADTDLENLSMIVDGSLSIIRRVENRVADLEEPLRHLDPKR